MAKLIHKILKPKGRWRLSLIRALNRYCRCQAINIGGGPAFGYLGWLNLEEMTGPANPQSFKLTPSCRFPIGNESIPLAYTSHCLEHLGDSTVTQVLNETHRVLERNGDFIVKIPDFDLVLTRWKQREADFFSDDIWGMGTIKGTWCRRGVEDCIHSRAAMIFCGYWNEIYGQHFGKFQANHPDAYHGPPAIPPQELDGLLTRSSPHEIAVALRDRVTATETGFHFNHQNAWSREEMAALLESHRFKVATFDAGQILAQFPGIPTLGSMQSISLYCLAKKVA